MAAAFGTDEALEVFNLIDTDQNSLLSKVELQNYCSCNNISWSAVVTALNLR